jgi:predicted nucleotidyltransferase
MREWLRQVLSKESSIGEAYVFGSVMRGEDSPKDFDMVLISVGSIESEEWAQVRAFRDIIRSSFQQQFGLPLSILIASPSEWRSLKRTVCLHREALLPVQ